MDFDLKIGAVFSLADDRMETHEDKTDLNTDHSLNTDHDLNADHGHLLSDRDDTLSMNVYNTQSPPRSLTSSRTDNETPGAITCYLDDGMNESLSAVEDQDTPPSLLLEEHDSPNLIPPSFIPNLECMAPPVLLPEEPLKRAISPEKKKCTKIAPCYIVLTNIDSTMQTKLSISSRAFKRSFVECSNMCKKVMFRRRLRAGKDVFNVKTPSKQKDYLLYLMKEQEKSKKNKKNIVQCTKIQDIIEKHDLKVAARKNSFGKQAHPRVRRTVSKLPKDFASRPVSPLQEEMIQNMEDVSTEVLKRIQSEYAKKKHKVELNSLKRLIGIKRSLNQNLKKSKRLRPDRFENFLTKSDVTSSVSGRVRKVNRKYGVDFAVSRKEIEEQRLFEVAQSQLKRAESESKRKKEEISFDYMLQKRRKISVDTEAEKMATSKKVKAPVITIENPEKDDITETQVKIKKSNANTKKLNAKAHAIKALLESSLVGNKLTSSINVKNTKQKRCQNANNDAVLIQDLPKEENVICGFLQENENPLTKKSFVNDNNKTTEIKDGEQYGRAKQLLKDSIDRKSQQHHMMKQNIFPKQEKNDSNDLSSHTTDEERFKVLRIPETVQKLFTSKEIKQEPVDDGYETATSSSMCSNSKIVTIAYSNGLYKKVVMTVPTTASVTPSKQITSITKPSNIVSTPVLVNTKQGLRYLVPNQMFSKLPSYSDAIKAKFLPQKSDTPSIAPMASLSNVIDGTTNYIYNETRNKQSSNEVKSIQSSFQSHPQEKYVNSIPTVIQIPLNTVTNSSNSNSILKLASSSAVVCQPSVNKAFQQTIKSIKSPVCTTSKQTHTVVHKVSPAVQKKFGDNISHLIQQQSVPMKSTVEFSNTPYGKKTVEKSKFYLLKIDGKNVLIPVEGDQTQPKAYVVNSDVINSNTVSKNQDSLATSTALSNNPTTEGIRSAFLGCSPPIIGTQKKPTLAVVPNVKPGNVIFPSQLALAPNATRFSQNKSLLQTVTLTNMETVSKGEVVNRTILNGANKTTANTDMVERPNTVVGNTAILSGNITMKNETNIVIVPSNSVPIVKTTTAFTNVVKSGSLLMTPKSVTPQSGLMQSNATNIKQNSLTVVPVFLKPSDTSPVCGILQSKVVPARTKNVFTTVRNQLDAQTEAKAKTLLGITKLSDAQANNALLQNQVSSFKNSLVVKHGQTKGIFSTVRSQLDSLREVKTKTLQGISDMPGDQSDETLLQKDKSPLVITKGQTINNVSEHEGKCENNEKAGKVCEKSGGKLCEKSGKFESKETRKETAEQAVEAELEPRPFKEAVSAREERLRRLKELLKEKQKAVEDIRSNKPK